MTWSILPELSAWHAARLVASGFGRMHPDVATAIAPLVERIGPADIERQIAAIGGIGSTPVTASLNDSFELYDAVRSVVPVAEELPTRIGPLKMQWEARGPGMLSNLRSIFAKPTNDQGFDADANSVGQVQILPVFPWIGGYAQPLPESRAVMIEAVLTDGIAELPETVRLAWAHAQLFGDDAFTAQQMVAPPSLHALTTIMPTLAAAEHVQLARCDAATVKVAIESWLHSPPSTETVTTLMNWWNEWSREIQGGAADWPMAVSALAV